MKGLQSNNLFPWKDFRSTKNVFCPFPEFFVLFHREKQGGSSAGIGVPMISFSFSLECLSIIRYRGHTKNYAPHSPPGIFEKFFLSVETEYKMLCNLVSFPIWIKNSQVHQRPGSTPIGQDLCLRVNFFSIQNLSC